MLHRTSVPALCLLLSSLAPGCAPEAEDAERFREAIPRAAEVALGGPESRNAAAARSSASAGEEPWAQGPWAHYYGFTREVRDGVNEVTAAVLGAVWLVVHTRPTSLDDGEVVWGPWADALSPVEWRFRVTRVEERTYEYRWEGRPKGSESAYRAVLSGVGYGRRDRRHGDGRFTIDLDAGRALDPFEFREGSGRLTVDHDLDPAITTDLFAGDRRVTAEYRPTEAAARWTATSLTRHSGEGLLRVTALDDLDDQGDTLLEAIDVRSQWRSDGAGRAEAVVSGGDVPSSVREVRAVECWGADFRRTYYADDQGYWAGEGEESACALPGTVPAP